MSLPKQNPRCARHRNAGQTNKEKRKRKQNIPIPQSNAQSVHAPTLEEEENSQQLLASNHIIVATFTSPDP
jgi:hypothetical protein